MNQWGAPSNYQGAIHRVVPRLGEFAPTARWTQTHPEPARVPGCESNALWMAASVAMSRPSAARSGDGSGLRARFPRLPWPPGALRLLRGEFSPRRVGPERTLAKPARVCIVRT